jgi:hypothetical protein
MGNRTYPNRGDGRKPSMDTSADVYVAGLFDDRYRAFLETVVEIRPRLHRYCARSIYIMEGEARTMWEHSVPPVHSLRYPLMFRTLPTLG